MWWRMHRLTTTIENSNVELLLVLFFNDANFMAGHVIYYHHLSRNISKRVHFISLLHCYLNSYGPNVICQPKENRESSHVCFCISMLNPLISWGLFWVENWTCNFYDLLLDRTEKTCTKRTHNLRCFKFLSWTLATIWLHLQNMTFKLWRVASLVTR